MATSAADPEPLLDTRGAVEYLGLREAQVRELVFRRQIPYTKVGRRLVFERARLDEWMEARARRARA